MITKLKTEVLGGDEEAFEVPEGWEIFRTAFDRGLWYVVLRKQSPTAKDVEGSQLDPLEA